MAIVVADRVKVRARTTGTGPFTVESTFPGFQGFEAVGDGNETYYGIFDVAGNWEVGQGTYTASGQTLSRDVIIASSNSGSVVDFPDGGKTLYVTVPSTILTTLAGSIPNSFLNIAVSGQTTISADSPTDILTIAAGTGIAITTDAVTDTLTITSTATASDSFKNIAVSGQSTVVADNSADTLTLVAGDNITITTDAANDTITITGADVGDVLPSQTGNEGKYLTTDGTNLSWGVVEGGGGGGGSSSSFDFTVAADDSTMVVINAGETLKIIGGDGISTASNAEGAITVTSTFSGSYLDLLNKPSIPVSLLDLGISDGTSGQVLTTNGSGTFTFQTPVTYSQSAASTTGGANLRLAGSNAVNDDVKFASGTNVTVVQTDVNTITISSTDTNTTYGISAETSGANTVLRLTGSDAGTDDVAIAAGSGVSVARTDANTITISSTGALGSRTTSLAATPTLADGDSANLTITGYKGYLLLKITTSQAAWVRVYTDDASRTADASRSELTDPTPGSGVIAEVITTGAETVIMSPAVFGFNNEGTPTTDIPVRVTNKSGSGAAITVTLTIIQMES
jgi:hypothetical protein